MTSIRNRRMCFRRNSSNHPVCRHIPAEVLVMDLAQALVTRTAPVHALCRTGWTRQQASALALVLVSVPALEQALVPAPEQGLCRTGPLASWTQQQASALALVLTSVPAL